MILVRHHHEGNYEPYFYFALEDYLLNEVLKDGESYFFTWEIKGVVIGKNQIIENEVNLDFLKANDIKLFRRPTGGGTVYADENNTMFSMIARRQANFSFKEHLNHIIKAVEKLGVTLEFSGRNDILFQGKKVSGNAFLQNKNGMLLHGTFLYDANLETMIRSITPDDEKLVSKGIESVRSRVTNLKPYLGTITQRQLVAHFEKEITDQVYTLTDAEVAMLKERAKKYASKAWIFHQQAAYTKSLKARIGGGLFNLQLLLQEGKIKDFNISGDFFELQPLTDFTRQFIDVYYNKESLDALLSTINLNDYFLDVNKESFINLLYSGIIE
jgi:lipoate-protein ligase A